MRFLITLLLITFLSACGGGSDTDIPASNVVSTNININASKSYVGESVTISWTSNNASSCSASGDWSGEKVTSGSETITLQNFGNLTFDIVCSNSEFSDSASLLLPVFKYTRVSEEFSNSNNPTWEGNANVIAFGGNALTNNYLYSNPGFYDRFEPIIDFTFNFTIPYLPEGLYRDSSQSDYYETSVNDVTLFKTSDSLSGIRYYSNGTLPQVYTVLTDPSANESNNIREINSQSSIWETTYMHYRRLNDSVITQLIRAITENEYSSSLLVEIFTDIELSIFSTRIGDKTELDDIPINDSKRVDVKLFAYIFDSSVPISDDYSNSELEEYLIRDNDGILFASGVSSLIFDFSTNTFSSEVNNESLNFTKFTQYGRLKDSFQFVGDLWRHGEDAVSISDLVFEIQDGIISGNTFYADISLAGSNQEHSAGFIKGNFYGPDASEIALEITFYDIPPNQQCGYSNGNCNYKILTGSGIGALEAPTN